MASSEEKEFLQYKPLSQQEKEFDLRTTLGTGLARAGVDPVLLPYPSFGCLFSFFLSFTPLWRGPWQTVIRASVRGQRHCARC